jgi:hypothetical protein
MFGRASLETLMHCFIHPYSPKILRCSSLIFFWFVGLMLLHRNLHIYKMLHIVEFVFLRFRLWFFLAIFRFTNRPSFEYFSLLKPCFKDFPFSLPFSYSIRKLLIFLIDIFFDPIFCPEGNKSRRSLIYTNLRTTSIWSRMSWWRTELVWWLIVLFVHLDRGSSQKTSSDWQAGEATFLGMDLSIIDDLGCLIVVLKYISIQEGR